jgi:hypothetical protein
MRVGLRQRQSHRVFNQEPDVQQLQHRPITRHKYPQGDASLEQRPLLRYGIHLNAIDDDSRGSQPPNFQCLAQKIVRQRRHITDCQFPNLAATDPLGFPDRALAIFEDPPGVDQERLTSRRLAPLLFAVSRTNLFRVRLPGRGFAC